MHVVVFDIDVTLVDSSEVNSHLKVEAVEYVLGIQVDDNWSRYTHVTDSGILNEIMDEAGDHWVWLRDQGTSERQGTRGDPALARPTE